MLKVLHIIPGLGKGGAERLVLDICNELSVRENTEVRLVTLHPQDDYSPVTRNFEKRTIPASVQLKFLSAPVIQNTGLQNFIRDFSPDIIHTHLLEAEITAATLGHNARRFSHIHNNIPELKNFAWSKAFQKKTVTDRYEKKWLLKQYRKNKNRFIAISKETQRYAYEVLPESFHPDIHLLPNAIDVNCFRNERERNLSSVIQLVNCGRFFPEKNQVLLPDVLLLLRQKGYDARLTFIGDGPLRKSVEEKTEQLGLTEYITFAGSVNNVEEYYRQADIYVHSATSEPFGLVLVEAMASGLPVVMTDGKGNRDLSEDGKNSLLVPDFTPEQFVEKVEMLILQPELYREMSRYTREYAQSYDIKKYVDKLLDLYRQAKKDIAG